MSRFTKYFFGFLVLLLMASAAQACALKSSDDAATGPSGAFCAKAAELSDPANAAYETQSAIYAELVTLVPDAGREDLERFVHIRTDATTVGINDGQLLDARESATRFGLFLDDYCDRVRPEPLFPTIPQS